MNETHKHAAALLLFPTCVKTNDDSLSTTDVHSVDLLRASVCSVCQLASTLLHRSGDHIITGNQTLAKFTENSQYQLAHTYIRSRRIMQNSSASPCLNPSPLSHPVRISSFLPRPLLPHPLTCSGGWDLDFNCLPFLNHRALETHAGEELRNIVCRLCDTHTFVDSINRYHLLTVGQLLGRGGGGGVQQTVVPCDAYTWALSNHLHDNPNHGFQN